MKRLTASRKWIGALVGVVLLLAGGRWAVANWAELPPEKTDQEVVNELLLENKRLVIECKQLTTARDARPEDDRSREAAALVFQQILRTQADVIAINRRNPAWRDICGPDPDPEVRQWFCEPAAANR
ncbi:hypothetical protein [Fimbriiglobus ruber]|uniref:Uncharacterized protein n=1 Tax=Fimbriiglobus ruber TaxID=1908690 RepID=A0A225E9K0_9BACT|nr:hypothetical protein [Fimbriiglobus ruber]OWK45255.1 hypothetical protein FRUB_01586 [Fimbriiglobus ruber]